LTGLDSDYLPWEGDGHGHGTHCSGTIAAARNGRGVVDVAPDAEIYTVRVFDDNAGWAYASGLLDAVYRVPGSGRQDCQLELGSGGYSSVANAAYKQLFEDGVLLIAASGNAGNTQLSYGRAFSLRQ
jgi:serine protease